MKGKKYIPAVCAAVVVMIILGIGWYTQRDTNAPKEEGDTSRPVAVDVPDSTAPMDSTDTVEDTASSALRTVEISRPDIMIYTGPGYDYSDVGTLVSLGTHTVTEEETDREGITWGRLASGDGWIDLIRAAETPPHIPLTMELDLGDKLVGREYHEHTVTESEYTQRLLFRAYEQLTNIRFTMLDVTLDGVVYGAPLYTLAVLEEDTPLVIGVVFFGDLTTYGLSFTDASGVDHHYMLYTSGRNGSVVMQRYTPAEN